MNKLFLLLIIPACAAQTIPTPTKQAREAEYYIPTKIYATQVSCALTATDKFGIECTAIPKLPTWADCLPSYHKERQILCTTNNKEPSESRVVCHLNVTRGYTNLCGMECAMHMPAEQPPIIMPPTLDRQEALKLK